MSTTIKFVRLHSSFSLFLSQFLPTWMSIKKLIILWCIIFLCRIWYYKTMQVSVLYRYVDFSHDCLHLIQWKVTCIWSVRLPRLMVTSIAANWQTGPASPSYLFTFVAEFHVNRLTLSVNINENTSRAIYIYIPGLALDSMRKAGI